MLTLPAVLYSCRRFHRRVSLIALMPPVRLTLSIPISRTNRLQDTVWPTRYYDAESRYSPNDLEGNISSAEELCLKFDGA